MANAFLLSFINEQADDATEVTTPLATSTSISALKELTLDYVDERFGDDFSELEWVESNPGVLTFLIDEDGGYQMYQIESIKSV